MQSFRLEFSTQGGCYDFVVREKDRCEEFLSLFIGKLSSFSFFTVIISPFFYPLFTVVRLIELDMSFIAQSCFLVTACLFWPVQISSNEPRVMLGLDRLW